MNLTVIMLRKVGVDVRRVSYRSQADDPCRDL